MQRLRASGLDVLCGEVSSPEYEAIHRRRILFVDDDYWIVHDALTGSRPHRYDLRFHLAPGAPGVAVLVAPSWPVALEEGWISASYGLKEAAPIVTATADGVACAEFFTLLMPLSAAAPMPAFQIARHVAGGEDVLVADISRATPGGMRHDRVMWTASGNPAALPTVGTAEAAAIFDLASDGARIVTTVGVAV